MWPSPTESSAESIRKWRCRPFGHCVIAIQYATSQVRDACLRRFQTKKRSSISSLDIRSNNIKGDGLCSIADAVKFNSALTELFIWGNVHEERACLVIANERGIPLIIYSMLWLGGGESFEHTPLRSGSYWRDTIPCGRANLPGWITTQSG